MGPLLPSPAAPRHHQLQMGSENCHHLRKSRRQRGRGANIAKKLLAETIISLQKSMHFNSYEDICLLLRSF